MNRIDLNLYLVLDAIYEEGNLSRAAKRLFLTQPAVSHALGRLRNHYQDPLFVRRGKRMEPTPMAQRIRPQVQQALQQLQGTLQSDTGFNPAQSRKRFALGMRDHVESMMIPRVMSLLENEAPMTQLVSVHVRRRDMEAELAAARLDLAFDVLLPVGPRILHQPLLADGFRVVARKDHPQIGKRLSIKQYLEAKHIVVSSRQSGPSVEDFELSRLGYRRQIAMRCQHLYVAMKTVEATDLLLTMPTSMVNFIAQKMALKSWKMPVELPSLAVHMYWHENRDQDNANAWLRGRVLQLVS